MADDLNKASRAIPATSFHTSRDPQNPRQDMQPTEMNPDEARRYIREMFLAMRSRVNSMAKSNSGNMGTPANSREKMEDHFGKDTYQLFSGITAALRQWDESGEDVKELKDEYGGTFVEGVEIGERLAPYEGREFEFPEVEDDEKEIVDETERFTFIQ